VLFIGTVGVPALASLFRPLYVLHYSIISLAPFVALVASVLHALVRPRALLAACGALLTAALAWTALADTSPMRSEDKAAAQHIADRAGERDVVLYTGLSRAAVHYYLQRLRPGHRLAEISFPGEIERHPGWYDSDSWIADPARLRGELDRVLRLVEENMGPGVRLWLLYEAKPMNHAFKRELEGRMGPVEAVPLRGSDFSEVLVYSPRRKP
jgi:hypothetical protein